MDMKIDRLVGILSVLLQKDHVTEPYLAEKFEVSRRTISRDINDLCKAGIPIAARQGVNGGIYIMPGYKIDCTLLTVSEMQDILAGLRSLDSVNDTNCYGQLMEKLYAGSYDINEGSQYVIIDLSSWYKDSLAPKIKEIRKAIEHCLEIEFEYYSPRGEGIRTVEPYYLLFRWSNWYVWGWCSKRKDYRLFKLNRMDSLKITDNTFTRREAEFPYKENEHIYSGDIHVKAVFDSCCKWRLVEEYGTGCFKEQSDGKLLFSADFDDKDYLINWIMSFRENAEVVEPEEIRNKIISTAEKITEKYSDKSKK